MNGNLKLSPTLQLVFLGIVIGILGLAALAVTFHPFR
jgi:hypothetical protein